MELNVAPPDGSWKSIPTTERVDTSRFGCALFTLATMAVPDVMLSAGGNPIVQLEPLVHAVFPARSAQVKVALCGSTVIVSPALPVPPALLAPMVALNVPLTLGVPLINPRVVSTANPAGKPLAA